MQITDILAQMGGLHSMAQELGVSESQVASGAAALAPAILGGFKKQAPTSDGGGLGSLLAQLGGSGQPDLAPQATDVDSGNAVLGQLFGSKDVSRTVAQHAAAQTGLDPSLLKKMLPMLAMLVTAYLAKQQASGTAAAPASTGGGLGGLLGGLFGGQGSGSATPGSAAPGWASLLDLNSDGNPLDDILRAARKAMD